MYVVFVQLIYHQQMHCLLSARLSQLLSDQIKRRHSFHMPYSQALMELWAPATQMVTCALI